MKAVALISGGLDSVLAAKIIGLQGVEVIGIAFTTPFTHPEVENLAQDMGIEIRAVDISMEYLDLIRNPCFGFGRNLNPCIDCHIFMLKKAREFMLTKKADFIVTGEVLGQRPMSQRSCALTRIEKEAGIQGLLLRPLSAQLLAESIPEQKGWVQRSGFFGLSGRSRKPQLEMARRFGIEGFRQPAGGCLLTDPGFSRRLKDLLTYQREFDLDDIRLLKFGRHFRLSKQAKLVLGRNQEENQHLISFFLNGNFLLEPVDIPGPVGIFNYVENTDIHSRAGIAKELVLLELLELSARILTRYCSQENNHVGISIETNNDSQLVHCSAEKESIIDRLRI